MKKTQLFTALLFVSFFLTSCAPRFPQVDSYYISPFELTEKEKIGYTDLALSPNGETILVDGAYIVRLKSGERENLSDKFEKEDWDILENSGYWSFDGRYLGIQAKHYERSRDPVGYAFYVLDMQDNSVKRYADLWATRFSPFNSYQVTSDKGIYNLKDGTIIPYPVDFDLSQEQEFGATDYGTLWSKSLGAPVAELGSLPHSDNADVEIALQSYNPMDPAHPKYSIPVGLTIKHPNQLARILFNLTGEYILGTGIK
jgi:hypothetical protein